MRASGPIEPAGLENIATYKYKAGVYTPLDNLLNPVWTQLTELLPMWLAPNVVTSIGGGCNMLIVTLCTVFSPSYEEMVPSWVLQINGVLLITGYFLDCMDGKQARRTGNSSPLGQLFDHGTDALGVMAHFCMVASMMSPNFANDRLLLAAWATFQTAFFFAQWVEYNVHELHHCIGGVFGITEMNCSGGLLSIGVSFIDRTALFSPIGPTLPLVGDITPAKLGGLGWVTLQSGVIVHGFQLVSAKVKGADFQKAVMATGPALVAAVVTVFGFSDEVVTDHKKLICMTVWPLVTYNSVQVIIFAMGRQELVVLQWPTALYLLAAVATRVAGPSVAAPLLLSLFFLFFAVLIEWAVSASNQITTRLGIRVFHVKSQKD